MDEQPQEERDRIQQWCREQVGKPYVYGQCSLDGIPESMRAAFERAVPTVAEIVAWYEEVGSRLHQLQAGLMLSDLTTHPDLAELDDEHDGDEPSPF